MAAAENEMNVPFEDMVELCQISSSQEEILNHCPFFDPDGGEPPSSDGIPVASIGIAMATLPETAQDAAKEGGSQEVFHTPPEQQSSQSASDIHGRVIHKAGETDDETQGFFDFSEYTEATEYVDLRDDSELGLPIPKLNQRTDRTLVAECLHGDDGASGIEISNCEMNKFRISKRELSSKDSLGESPHKKMKNSEQNPGLESSQARFGIEPLEIEQNLENYERKSVSNPEHLCDTGAIPQPESNVQIVEEMCLGLGDKKNHYEGISAEKNLGSCENPGSHVTQSGIARSTEECVENIESEEGNYEAEKLACPDEGNKPANEIAETFERQKKGGDEQPESSVFPSSTSEIWKNIAKIKKEIEKGNDFVFDVLKALREENSEEDSLENVSWLHLANTRGFNFPRPRWWDGE